MASSPFDVSKISREQAARYIQEKDAEIASLELQIKVRDKTLIRQILEAVADHHETMQATSSFSLDLSTMRREQAADHVQMQTAIIRSLELQLEIRNQSFVGHVLHGVAQYKRDHGRAPSATDLGITIAATALECSRVEDRTLFMLQNGGYEVLSHASTTPLGIRDFLQAHEQEDVELEVAREEQEQLIEVDADFGVVENEEKASSVETSDDVGDEEESEIDECEWETDETVGCYLRGPGRVKKWVREQKKELALRAEMEYDSGDDYDSDRALESGDIY